MFVLSYGLFLLFDCLVNFCKAVARVDVLIIELYGHQVVLDREFELLHVVVSGRDVEVALPVFVVDL